MSESYADIILSSFVQKEQKAFNDVKQKASRKFADEMAKSTKSLRKTEGIMYALEGIDIPVADAYTLTRAPFTSHEAMEAAQKAFAKGDSTPTFEQASQGVILEKVCFPTCIKNHIFV